MLRGLTYTWGFNNPECGTSLSQLLHILFPKTDYRNSQIRITKYELMIGR